MTQPFFNIDGSVVEAARFVLENKTEKPKEDDESNSFKNTLNEKIRTFSELPRIEECFDMREPTEPSLTHQKVFHSIMLIMHHPVIDDKTLVRFFNDKNFDYEQDVVLDVDAFYAIVSLDRRSQQDQETSRFIVLALKTNDLG